MLRFNKKIMGTRESDHYATPKRVYARLNEEFNFDFDPTPLRSDFNSLEMDWHGAVYCNPPYSNIQPFLEKGIEQISIGNARQIVYLLPVRTDVKYFHEIVGRCRFLKEIRFIRGRLDFNDCGNPAPFPTFLLIFQHGDFERPDIVFDY